MGTSIWASVGAFFLALFKAIPIFDRWFRKSEQEKEREQHAQVDQEQAENREPGKDGVRRPSGDFWKEHGP